MNYKRKELIHPRLPSVSGPWGDLRGVKALKASGQGWIWRPCPDVFSPWVRKALTRAAHIQVMKWCRAAGKHHVHHPCQKVMVSSMTYGPLQETRRAALPPGPCLMLRPLTAIPGGSYKAQPTRSLVAYTAPGRASLAENYMSYLFQRSM